MNRNKIRSKSTLFFKVVFIVLIIAVLICLTNMRVAAGL